MKKTMTSQLGLLMAAVAIFVASCSSNASISKRYHNRGFNIAWGGGNNTTPAKPVTKKAKLAHQVPVEHVATEMAISKKSSELLVENLEPQKVSSNLENSGKIKGGDLKMKSPLKQSVNMALSLNMQKKIQVHSTKGHSKLSSDPDGPIFGILAFVFGLLGWLAIPILFSLAAIVLGIMGLKKDLNGLAIAGLVLGGLQIIILILAVIVLLLGM